MTILPFELSEMNTVATSNRNIRSSSTIAVTSLNIAEIGEEFQSPTLGRKSTSALCRDTYWNADNDSDNVLHVAVPKDYKEGKSVLGWALTYFPLVKKIILVHIHQPSQSIPMIEGRFPINQVDKAEVQAYHQLEREKVDKALNDYTPVCRIKKVQAENLIVDNNDVAKGLLELIELHGIQKLVMGAAADQRYSKDMNKPKSSLACTLLKDAQPQCQIWFVCKGNLICTREGSSDQSLDASPLSSSSTTSTRNNEELLPVVPSRDDDVDDHGSSVFNGQRESEDQSFGVHAGAVLAEDLEIPFTYEKVKVMESKYLKMKHEAHEELQRKMQEVEKLRRCHDEILAELCETHEQRLDLEMQAKKLEVKYAKETQLRKEAEELLQREKQEVQNLRQHKAENSEELRKAREQQLAFELQVAEYNNAVNDLNEKLSEMQRNLDSLSKELDILLLEKDVALTEVKDLCQGRNISGSSQRRPIFTEFSYLEIYQATNGFSGSNCIGEGGYGRVHKGFLGHTTVAIKLLDAKSLQGQDEFHREIEVLSRVRHPNLVTLIGACLEAWALVYEFLPNGSLEDRLICKGNTPPLPWQARTRICAEICSGLIFLHSNKPDSIVHGNVKPANILLDSNFTCKIGDFGISRLLTQSSTTTTLYRQTDPKGTFHYMDPEFGTTGMLTYQSDIFSFGVIILRLLTGAEPHGIVRIVNEALNSDELQNIIDPSAGEWPFVQAQQLANLGIRCCEMNRRNRPDLVRDVWRVLEPMKNASSKFSILGSPEEDRSHTPSYFICPIFQEIMRDPHIAADGFTYEAEALRGWIESGHDTSPMTNLKLENDRLIPNHTLRSAIQEWLQQGNSLR